MWGLSISATRRPPVTAFRSQSQKPSRPPISRPAGSRQRRVDSAISRKFTSPLGRCIALFARGRGRAEGIPALALTLALPLPEPARSLAAHWKECVRRVRWEHCAAIFNSRREWSKGIENVFSEEPPSCSSPHATPVTINGSLVVRHQNKMGQ